MPKYEVTAPDGHSYEVTAPDGASQDQVLAYAKSNYSSPATIPGFDVPPLVQKGAAAILTPGRGLRGIGVGAEKIINAIRSGDPNDFNLQDIASRSAAATQPDFQARPGEKLGAAASSLVDPVNLAAGLIPGVGAAKAIGAGAALSGGSTLLDQAERGHVDPMSVLRNSAIGGALGFLTDKGATLARDFLSGAPKMISDISKNEIPIKSTNQFIADKNIMQGIPKTQEGLAANVESKAAGVNQTLQGLDMSQKADQQFAGLRTNTNMTPKERAKFIPAKASDIPDEVDRMEMLMPQWIKEADARIAKAKSMGLSPDEVATVTNRAAWEPLKQLLNIRHSISERIGQPDEFGIVKGGLAEYRPRINAMIEQLPGGDAIRNADQYTAQVKDLHSELLDSLKTPGKTIKFVKSIMASNDTESTEKLKTLLAMEKLSGKPVIDDMMKAITQSNFAPDLAGNTIKRSILGISPFLISGLMRVGGVPFQASLPLAAALTTAGQSPAIWGNMIRAAQAVEPYAKPAAKATAVAGLAALRQLQGGK